MYFIAALLLLAVPASAYTQDFRSQVDSLSNYSFDDSREIEVKDLRIELPGGYVHLEAGQLYLTGYFHGGPTAAFFTGRGRFFYYAPDEAETQQIRRYYQADSILVDLDQVYLAFPWNSWILKELNERSRPANPSFRIKTLFDRIRKIPDSKFRYNLSFHIYKAAMEGRSEFLYVDCLKDEFRHTFYSFDPYAYEQVSVYKYSSDLKAPRIVSSIRVGSAAEAAKFQWDFIPEKYNIDVDISTYAKSSIECRVEIGVNADSLKYVDFILPSEYRVDSIGGDAVQFIKEKDRAELLLELSRFFHKGEKASVSVWYRTNLFYHFMGGVMQSNLIYWYPGVDYRCLANYDMKYSIDEGYDFISVGRKVLDTISKGIEFLEYRSPRPISYVSFNYGKFDTVRVEEKGVPITIYFIAETHKSPIFGSPVIKRVVDDVAGSFRFYSEVFAPYPFGRLDIAAMPVGYGQGSPGVVHLSELTFNRSEKGTDDKFRAHEMAHQWWGHLVSPARYRDAWLSEGLAEYSAAMFIERDARDEKIFRKILRDWREMIVEKGQINGAKSIGFRAGAVILGDRLASELSPGDYQVIVYFKAAYLLHMLRYELRQIYGDDIGFFEMLASFAKTYAGKLVTTDDFISNTRKYIGERADPFFEQWLYDWRVPKITKKYKVGADGSIDFSFDVMQVGDRFETPYPVEIRFSDSSVKTVIFQIKRGVNAVRYTPDNTSKVKGIEFNPNDDILEQ